MSKEIKFVCCSADPKTLKNLSNDLISDDDAVITLKKIAHPIRLKILRLLLNQSEICSCELTQLFDESQPEISRQLGILAESGIIVRRKLTIQGVSGRWHAYRLDPMMRDTISHIIQPFTKKGIQKVSE